MRYLSLPLLIFFSAGCATEPPGLSDLESGIFAQSCTNESCHGGAGPARGLDLQPGKALASLVGVASPVEKDAAGQPFVRVVPGKPDESLLYLALTRKISSKTRQMPPGLALSADEIAAVREWIAAGAKDD